MLSLTEVMLRAAAVIEGESAVGPVVDGGDPVAGIVSQCQGLAVLVHDVGGQPAVLKLNVARAALQAQYAPLACVRVIVHWAGGV